MPKHVSHVGTHHMAVKQKVNFIIRPIGNFFSQVKTLLKLLNLHLREHLTHLKFGLYLSKVLTKRLEFYAYYDMLK